MKKYFTLVCLILCSVALLGDQLGNQKISDLKQLIIDHPVVYQDIIYKNRVVKKGYCNCIERYKIIEKIIKEYNAKEFSMLDIGAAQGYFDFKIAHQFPGAHCTMLEGKIENSAHTYAMHADLLLKLCKINDYLPNITLLTKYINGDDLIFLNQHEHFDVVLALLVIHQFPGSAIHEEYQRIIDNIIKLGNLVIIEVSDNAHGEEAEKIFASYNPIFLGSIRRYINPLREHSGNMYLFKNNREKTSLNVSDQIYDHFQGVYHANDK